MVNAGLRGVLRAAEEGLALRGRRPPVEVAHLDLGHLDAVVFILLVIHLEGVGWCLLPETSEDAQVSQRGDRRKRWDRRGWGLRGKCRAVNIAASVDVSRTGERSGGGFGVLEKRSMLLKGIWYLASPYKILAVVNFRLVTGV